MSTNVFVDVDLTLVNADGQMLDGAHEALVNLRAGGCTLFLWSAAGADYARSVADRHDLTGLFEGFSAKPDVAIDDMPETATPLKILSAGRNASWASIGQEILSLKDSMPGDARRVSPVKAHIMRTLAHVNSSAHQFEKLNVSSVPVCPIPFFGDVSAAEILTIGVNPSWTEFKNRLWPAIPPNADYLELRLRNYFNLRIPAPHPWFAVWEQALNTLEWSSYRTNAAHLDLSPRPTQFMRNSSTRLFQDMAAFDIGLLFELLEICPRVKLLMIAGTVTNEFYIDEFLAKEAPQHSYRLNKRPKRSSGQARTEFYQLVGPKRSLPVFFCAVSPSAPHSHMLVQRVMEEQNHTKLLSYLNCACATNN